MKQEQSDVEGLQKGGTSKSSLEKSCSVHVARGITTAYIFFACSSFVFVFEHENSVFHDH